MKNKSAGASGGMANQSSKAEKGKDSAAGMTNAERKYKNSEKYKKQQREKMKKRAVIFGLVALIVILVGSVSGYAAYQAIYGHIMTFDGKKISAADFKLLNAAMLSDSKQDTLDELTEYLIVEKMAEEKGIGLTSSEKTTVKQDIPDFKNYIISVMGKAPSAPEESYIRILGAGTLYSKFQQMYADSYEIDEDDFRVAFEEYLDTSKQYYIDTQMKYVMTETEDDALFAREMYITGMDIDEVIEQYSLAYENSGVETVPLSQLTLEQEDVDKILALEVSDASEVINIDYAFVFFVVDQINIPEEAEVEESYRELYLYQKASEVFHEDIDAMKNATDIVINQRAFDSVK